MESAKASLTEEEFFGRQPRPVTVTIQGEPTDVTHWLLILQARAERSGDMTMLIPSAAGEAIFRIYPRAVND